MEEFNNGAIYFEDTELYCDSEREYLLEGREEKVDIKFAGSNGLYVYTTCNQKALDGIKNNTLDISRITFYEGKNTALAKANNPVNADTIIEVLIDTRNGLDLLNLADLSRLRKFYIWGIENKSILKSIKDEELIKEYIQNQSNIKFIRFIKQLQNEPLLSNSSLLAIQCIAYKIYDRSIIQEINVVK